MNGNKNVLVFGATGNIGGAAARELLARGWQVRAVTRDPSGDKASTLSTLGAEVVQGDMDERGSVEAAFEGVQRVFSVQNWTTSGIEGELRQGKLVAEAARSAGVEHLVYGSAGTGVAHSGIFHFDNKVEVEDHMRELGLPFTVVRPVPFMELLTEKEFYPALATWGVEPKIVGWHTPIPWVAVRDIGITIAEIFENPDAWIGGDLTVCGDIKTLKESQEIFTKVDGKKPFGLPIPVGIFSKMASEEFVQMWKWLKEYVEEIGSQGLWNMVAVSKETVPEMLDLESWLKLTRNGVAKEFQHD